MKDGHHVKRQKLIQAAIALHEPAERKVIVARKREDEEKQDLIQTIASEGTQEPAKLRHCGGERISKGWMQAGTKGLT